MSAHGPFQARFPAAENATETWRGLHGSSLAIALRAAAAAEDRATLVVPLAWAVMQANQATDPGQMHILYASIAAVLAGSVWGDHCSPISDTTILSSMASGCDHIEHVRTQLPYALLVGAVALVVCALPVALGLPWWLALLASVLLLYAVLRLLGRKVGP